MTNTLNMFETIVAIHNWRPYRLFLRVSEHFVVLLEKKNLRVPDQAPVGEDGLKYLDTTIVPTLLG